MAVPRWLADLWYDCCYYIVLTTLQVGWSLRITGRRNVPLRGPVLIVGNHESFFDPPAIGVSTSRRLYYLARKSLYRNRVFGALLRSIHSVAVDQEGVAKEGLKAILELLKAGEGVVVFPEGERTWTGELARLKPGILLILKRLAVPVVPVGIAGAFEAFPRTQKWPVLSPLFWPRNGHDIAIAIGKPIPPDYYADMPREKILEDLYSRIYQMRERARQLRRKG
jgi:1-acyl-sn-glycerol-3-phosphate acyltransferase